MTGLVVIEGCDCTGKTTLARELIRLNGGRGHYIHLSYHRHLPFVGLRTYAKGEALAVYQFAALRRAKRLIDRGELVVIDRHWISDQVYGCVYRGAPDTDRFSRTQHQMICAMGGTYVLCVPPDVESVVERHRKMSQERHEMYDSEKIYAVAQGYQDFLCGIPKERSSPLTVGFASTLAKGGGIGEFFDFYTYYARYILGVTPITGVLARILDLQDRDNPYS